jgi:hypothetical protein
MGDIHCSDRLVKILGLGLSDYLKSCAVAPTPFT